MFLVCLFTFMSVLDKVDETVFKSVTHSALAMCVIQGVVVKMGAKFSNNTFKSAIEQVNDLDFIPSRRVFVRGSP